MPQLLPRKIRVAFLLQAFTVSLAILLGVWVVSVLIKNSYMHNMLQKEATYYWKNTTITPELLPPDTYNLRGFFSPAGDDGRHIPQNIRELSPGFHEVNEDNLLVLVEHRPKGRLYLILQRGQVTRMAFWFGTVPIGLALLIIYLATWITYRSSAKMVSPINWLAKQVMAWDPKKPIAEDLAPDSLPADLQGETRQLALALHALALRVNEHIAREREFTRNASHELRTPLTVVRVASDMLLSEADLSPRMQRSVQRIQRACYDMSAIIEAFLILAREADIEPPREMFEVEKVLEYEIETARFLLSNKPVELSFTCHAHPKLDAAPRVMHVVVSNLVRNACNYTYEGQIDVALYEDYLTVTDTGIGMTPEQLAHVFEPFYRADPNHPQGSGLGLAIVEGICKRFGWKITIESKLGKGTCARLQFVLPNEEEPEKSADN